MKKLLLLLCTLLGTVGAWAEVLNVTPADGTYVTSSGNYVNSISFATNPVLTVTASANNMDKRQTGDYLLWHSGSSGSSTYTLIVPNGCKITEYSITGEANTSAQTLTAGQISHEFAVGASSTFTVTGLNATSTSFVQTGANASGLKITAISVTILKPSDTQLNAYNTVQGWIPVIQSSNGLVKNASNYISNAKSTAEGSYEGLLDGDYATYFHSAYGGQGPDEDHYLQGEMSKSVNAVYIYYKKRSQNNNNRPTSITISGSNDGTNFTEVTTVSSGLPTDASVIDYTSDKINLGASYKYLRFTVTATNNGATSNGHVFFTFSEFYILPSNSDIDAAITAYKSYKDVAALDLTDAQIADINAVNTALTSTIVNVTYELYESDGTTLVASTTVEQLKNSEVSIPTSFENPYYNLTSQGNITTSDCTIRVIRTLKDGIVYPVGNLNNNKAYYIKTRYGNRGSLSTYTDGDVTYLASPVKSALGLNASGKKFAIINYEDHYYLYSVEDQKFVTYQAEQKAPLASTITGISDAIGFSATTAPLYELRFDGSASKIINSSESYSYGLVFNSWGDTSNEWDDGCQYTIEEAGTFDPAAAIAALTEFFHPSITVTYVVKDANNNTLFTSSPVATTLGAQFTTLPEEYQLSAFYTYNTVNVTINKSGNTNVTFTATPKADAPIKYTANASNPYYYNLNIRSKYLVYNAEATGEVTLQDTSEPFNANASWAFIGNPYNFKVINKAKGTSNYLTYTSVVTGQHSDNNIQFVADANFTNQYWIVDTNNNGIVLRMKENPSIYFHHDKNHNYLRTCSVGEWGSVHNDAGSTIVAATDEAVLVALYNEVKDFSFGSAIGQITVEGMTAAAATNAVSAAGTALANQTTSQYESAYNNLKNIVTNMSLNEPAAGFYRLKNVVTGKYLTITDPTTGYNNTEVKGVYANGDANSAATIIKLFDKDGNGKLYMYNQGYGFGWVGYGEYSGNVWATFNPDKYVHWFPGKAANQIAFAICLGNGEGDYASYLTKGIFTADTEDQSVIAGTDYTADAALWVVEPVNAPIEGDINADGAINAADVNVLVDVILGKKNAASYNMDASATYGLSDVTNQVNKYKK